MLALLLTLASAADVDTALQARLLTADGAPVQGAVSVSVTLFDSATGAGVVDGPRSLGTVDVEDGFLTATLPVDADALSTAGAVWVEYTVAGAALSPRHPLHTTPRAAVAQITRGEVVIESTSLAACDPVGDPGSVGRVIRANGTLYTCEAGGPVALQRAPNWNFCHFSNVINQAVTSAHLDHYDANMECTITSTGRPIKVEYCLGYHLSGGNNGGTLVRLWQDGVHIATPGYWDYNDPNDGKHGNNCAMWVVSNPAVGTRTFEIKPMLHSCGSCTYGLRQSHIFLTEL